MGKRSLFSFLLMKNSWGFGFWCKTFSLKWFWGYHITESGRNMLFMGCSLGTHLLLHFSRFPWECFMMVVIHHATHHGGITFAMEERVWTLWNFVQVLKRWDFNALLSLDRFVFLVHVCLTCPWILTFHLSPFFSFSSPRTARNCDRTAKMDFRNFALPESKGT